MKLKILINYICIDEVCSLFTDNIRSELMQKECGIVYSSILFSSVKNKVCSELNSGLNLAWPASTEEASPPTDQLSRPTGELRGPIGQLSRSTQKFFSYECSVFYCCFELRAQREDCTLLRKRLLGGLRQVLMNGFCWLNMCTK